MVRTRFAPSPTGGLHIGSIRTILFNWLYAKHHNGKFLLRIEDTDISRSKMEHVEEITQTLTWLGMDPDEEIVFQLKNKDRHQQVAMQLLEKGKAYKCYCTQEELQAERDLATQEGRTPTYSRKCRNLQNELDKPFTIRLKVETDGKTEFEDLIQGVCSVDNVHIDDMILLRSDGTPTYMLAVVIDDHDMKITHVIRGSEHLNNAYRQLQIYKACEWEAPEFAHVSLIHGEDGSKLSKRHGAVSLMEYIKQGFLKEAVLNYLLMLGWSFKTEEEIISMEECVKIFDIKDVRSSAARFSMHKLLSINSIYMRNMNNKQLTKSLKEFMQNDPYDNAGWKRIEEGMDELKNRVRTLAELETMSGIYGNGADHFGKITPDAKNQEFFEKMLEAIKNQPWNENASLEETTQWLKDKLEKENHTLKSIAQDLRIAITKENVAPGMFELMRVLGPNLFAERLSKAIA